MAEKLEYAGDYLIEKLELVTSAGVVVDLRSLYLGLTLYEDLFSLTVITGFSPRIFVSKK